MNQTKIIPVALAIILTSCSASSQTDTPFAEVTAVEVISGQEPILLL